MQRKLSGSPESWYREPWPWLLLLGPISVVVAGIVTAAIAVVNEDPLVVDNYYKVGLGINRAIAQDEAAARAGYRAQVMFSADRSRVRVVLTSDESFPGSLRLRLLHPTRAQRDRTVELEQMQRGWYEATLALPSAVRWHVQLEDEDRRWRLSGEWRPHEGAAVWLEPRRAR